jgi:Glucose / Sorbosone dehydrogenase
MRRSAAILAVLPDPRVLHTARTGQVRIHNPRTGLNTLADEVPIYQHVEEGLQGIAIDPDGRGNLSLSTGDDTNRTRPSPTRCAGRPVTAAGC